MSYVAMMIVDAYHNHPVLRTFVELLHQIQRERRISTEIGLTESKSDIFLPVRFFGVGLALI